MHLIRLYEYYQHIIFCDRNFTILNFVANGFSDPLLQIIFSRVSKQCQNLGNTSKDSEAKRVKADQVSLIRVADLTEIKTEV